MSPPWCGEVSPCCPWLAPAFLGPGEGGVPGGQDWELASCPALVPPLLSGCKQKGLTEWQGQGNPPRGGSGGGRRRGRGRCIPKEGDACVLLPSRPPGKGLESRLAPGGPGTLPYPAGYSGHSRAAHRLSACPGGPAWPATLGNDGCRELPSPALGPGKREGILGGALGPQPS